MTTTEEAALDVASLRARPYNRREAAPARMGRMRAAFRNWFFLSTLRKLAGWTGSAWLLDRPVTVRTRAGDELLARCRDLDGPIDVFAEGAYELSFLDWSSVSTVIDVGAHIGDFTLWVARRSPCRVYAIEPNPETYPLLRRNLDAAGLQARVHADAVALAGSKGRRRLRLAPISSASSLAEDGVSVEGVDLAALIERSGFKAVDLLKIDIEGAEREVFASLSEIPFERVGALILECHPGFDSGSLRSELSRLGYRVAEEHHAQQGMLVAWKA